MTDVIIDAMICKLCVIPSTYVNIDPGTVDVSVLGLGDSVNFTITIIAIKTSRFLIISDFVIMQKTAAYLQFKLYLSHFYSLLLDLLFEFWCDICPKIECFFFANCQKMFVFLKIV